jgi:methionine--tRNA ligase beta chain
MTISFDEFQKLDIRIGRILSAEKVAGTDKLIRMDIELGDEKRQIVAGIGDCYKPEELVDKKIPILANLEPKSFMGLESQGMILCAVLDNNEPVLIIPEKDVPSGTKIR